MLYQHSQVINRSLTTGILMFDDTGRFQLLQTRFTSPTLANTTSSYPSLLLFAKCEYDLAFHLPAYLTHVGRQVGVSHS